jgi:hypothetical protein
MKMLKRSSAGEQSPEASAAMIRGRVAEISVGSGHTVCQTPTEL